MAPKKSKVKVALGDWLTEDAGTSSWADEMDAMPTAPGEFQDMGFKRGGAGGDRPGFGNRDGGGAFGGDRDSRPPRADVPFPTQPPYTAFVGNMSFECTQEDVNEFFTNESLNVSNVRMVTDFNGKSKGFCYAEFPEADMLRHALTLTGAQLGGRTVRISVAEPPRADASGRSDGDWTRSGPLADLPGRGGPRPGGNRFEGAGGPPPDSGRDWGDARGSKFAPSAPSSPALGGGRPGFGGPRDAGIPRMGGFRDRDASATSPVVDDNRDWGAARGGRFAPAPPAPERKSGFADRKPSQTEELRDWRARAAPMSPPLSDSSSSAAAAPAAPVERKRLQLSARTVSSTSAPATDVTSPQGNKPSPFGSAVPVDTTAREAAIAERAAKEKADAEEAKKNAAAAASEDSATSPPAKKASNPFGSAKPVDISSREKEVEAKLAKDKEELEKKMKEAKIVEEKSATPQREWRRPSGPNAGLTGSTPNAPQSEIAKASTAPEVSSPPAAAPKQILKPGLRKEGFSYSNVAGTTSKSPAPTPAAETSSTDAKQTNGREAEAVAVADK